ncbi:MAG: hypothetical protein IMZ52_01580 [Actinobacteria bacterium]|nr:hypothetical protein [Actinomycetota bacterium]MBE3114827.1 hypothetical protein [Actinomycetota bacterium]
MVNEKRSNGHRKYYVNHNVFSGRMNADKAYWIGFLMADGNISKPKFGESQAITLQLQSRDLNHIYKYKKFLETDKVIYSTRHNCGIKGYNKQYDGYMLRITSDKIAKRLIHCGIIPQKSGKEKLININKIYERDYFRGYVDGDGCIIYGKTYANNCVELYGSYDICKQFKDFVINHGMNTKADVHKRNYSDILYVIRISGNHNVYKLLNLLYKDTSVYLDRKYNKAMQIIKRIDEHR